MLERLFGGKKKGKRFTADVIRRQNIADERALARRRIDEEKFQKAIIWELNILINDILNSDALASELITNADLFANDMRMLAQLMKSKFTYFLRSHQPLIINFQNQKSDSLLQLYNDLLTWRQQHQTILDVLSQGITIKYSATRRYYVNDIEYYLHTYELIGLVQLVDGGIKYSIHYCHNGTIQQSIESFDRTEISRFIATASSRNTPYSPKLWRE